VERFALVEGKCDGSLSDCSPEELDELWNQAKAILAKKRDR
jgi:hypothetical protein